MSSVLCRCLKIFNCVPWLKANNFCSQLIRRQKKRALSVFGFCLLRWTTIFQLRTLPFASTNFLSSLSTSEPLASATRELWSSNFRVLLRLCKPFLGQIRIFNRQN